MDRSTKLKHLLVYSVIMSAATVGTYRMADSKLDNLNDVINYPFVLEARAYQAPLEPQPQAHVVEEAVVFATEPMAVMEEVIPEPVVKRHWGTEEIDSLINQGYFSREDFEYLCSVGRECSTDYEGFYAVASCVLNRVKSGKYDSIKTAVTAPGQFEGYREIGSAEYNKYKTQEVTDAAVNILLAKDSTIGDSTYFYGRVNGFDLWADASVTEFYVIGGNVFFNSANRSKVHNQSTAVSAGDIIIYDSSAGTWNFGSGYIYQG